METVIGPVIGAFIGALVAGLGAAWIVGVRLGRLETKVEANGTAITRIEVKVDQVESKVDTLTGQFAEHVRQHVAAIEP